ncbi:MAG: hypothetical protein WBA74_00610 [Cyclobacteriaceae bacterium]
MSKPIVRVSDLYTNWMLMRVPTPIVALGSPTLIVESMPVIQVTDILLPAPDVALPGPVTVFHNNLPLNTMGGQTVQGGVLLKGATTVLIG